MYVCVYIYIIINIKVYHKTFPQFRTNYSWFYTLVSIKRKKNIYIYIYIIESLKVTIKGILYLIGRTCQYFVPRHI